MGVRGNVRRSTDGHIIHANVDTDVIISEEPEYGSTAKPEEIYAIIEHFSLGARTHARHSQPWLATISCAMMLSTHSFGSLAHTMMGRCRPAKAGAVWRGPQHPARLGDRRPPAHLLQLRPRGGGC